MSTAINVARAASAAALAAAVFAGTQGVTEVNGVPLLWAGSAAWAVLAFALVPLGQGLTALRYALVAAGVGLWAWVVWRTGGLQEAAAFFDPFGRLGRAVPAVLVVLPTVPAVPAQLRRPAAWLPVLAAAVPVVAVTRAQWAAEMIGPQGASDAGAHALALGAFGLYVAWALLDGGHRLVARCALAAAALLIAVAAAHALRLAGAPVEDLHLLIVGCPLFLVLDQAGVFGARRARAGREAVQHGW